MDKWLTFSNPDLSMAVKYPATSPQGYQVRVRESSTDTSYRAHFASDGSDEVYFEVGQYRNFAVRQAMDTFIKDLSERINGLTISKLEEIQYASFPAYRLSISWPGKERVILFIGKDGALYRIILDPSSPINKRILDSLEFL